MSVDCGETRMASKKDAGGSGLGVPRAGPATSTCQSAIGRVLHIQSSTVGTIRLPNQLTTMDSMDQQGYNARNSDWSGCGAICTKVEANVDWRGVEADMHRCWRQRPQRWNILFLFICLLLCVIFDTLMSLLLIMPRQSGSMTL